MQVSLQFLSVKMTLLIIDGTSATFQGQLVINTIIPAVASLRKTYHLTYSTMFSHFLFSGHPALSHVEMGDLSKSDQLFDSLLFK